jgi:integrase
MTLEVYSAPLRGIPIDKVTTDDVVAVLMPIWQRIPSTAQRLRGRIERILDAARVRKLRSGENPAAWRNNLKLVMPKQPKVKRRHAAMPFGDVPAFMKVLRTREAVAARCLEFLVLTAARVAEARCARWDELDLDAAVWAIPAHRMKERREHRVALSPQAIDLLREVEPLREGGYVFPGNRRGQPLSHSGLRELAQRAGISAATMHGFRSSFSSWAFSQTDTPAELIELSIAHAVGDEVVRAYRRTDALERRRPVMEAWASFCDTATGANIVPFQTTTNN